MEALENICACLPEEISRAVRERADSLTELRLRPGGRPQLCFAGSDALLKAPLAPTAFREVAARMLEHSLYAWEDELKQGFFTLPGGSRVGVCGRYALEDGRIGALTYISALCVRVSREVRGAGTVSYTHLELVRKVIGVHGIASLSRLSSWTKFPSIRFRSPR